MESDPNFLSEEEATRLWQRAAQLQADAARRTERPGSDRSESEPAESEKEAGAPPEGYALAQVRAAALEVGITAEFMNAALVDLHAERALPDGSKQWRLTRWYFKNPPDHVTARRVIHASVPDVLSAMEALFPTDPYRLTLTDRQGDPLEGGVLVFDIGGFGAAFPQGLAAEAGWAGYRRVFASLRPIEGATPACEVTLRGPVLPTQNLTAVVGVGLTGLAGGAGLGLGLAVAAALGALATGPVSVILFATFMVGGVALGGGLATKGFRAVCSYGWRKGLTALEGLLGAVASRAEGGWGINKLADPEPPQALPGTSNPSD